MITDRRWLSDPTPEALVRQVRRAAASGVALVQIRERDLEGRALFELCRLAVDAVRGSRTRLLVNDRLDVALAAGAHGVHLRAGSFPAPRVRGWVRPGFLIGQSVHSVEDAASPSARAADFLLYGHVFETSSKAGAPPRGLQRLAEVVRATPVPVLALGGMTAARMAAVMETGAAGFAAISMFAEADAR
jgi:thiamine-phosphate pyrophosphorylase